MEKITQTAGRDQLGGFAPDFAHYNDDILFGENWNNQDIDLKTRCMITVVALMASGITDSSLKYHLENAKAHGVTRPEMAAIVTHVGFYVGWAKAWAVFRMAKEVYLDDGEQEQHDYGNQHFAEATAPAIAAIAVVSVGHSGDIRHGQAVFRTKRHSLFSFVDVFLLRGHAFVDGSC